jgi:type II secretory pathway predicted ATPase ExeA
MRSKWLSAYGLKQNPFSPDVPVAALHLTDEVDAFCWRVEQQLLDGGFAAVIGDPGTGKSVVLRILSHRLGKLRDVNVGVLTRPRARQLTSIASSATFSPSSSRRTTASLAPKSSANTGSTTSMPRPTARC